MNKTIDSFYNSCYVQSMNNSDKGPELSVPDSGLPDSGLPDSDLPDSTLDDYKSLLLLDEISKN
ncbi:MAG TPA: hypothetical protein VI914_02195, partial [Thermodesulfobacteriota bacterium]|nr:hypothetical protein [Thermodesulfobacteriota bacterium]